MFSTIGGVVIRRYPESEDSSIQKVNVQYFPAPIVTSNDKEGEVYRNPYLEKYDHLIKRNRGFKYLDENSRKNLIFVCEDGIYQIQPSIKVEPNLNVQRWPPINFHQTQKMLDTLNFLDIEQKEILEFTIPKDLYEKASYLQEERDRNGARGLFNRAGTIECTKIHVLNNKVGIVITEEKTEESELVDGIYKKIGFQKINLLNGQYISNKFISSTFCNAKELFKVCTYIDSDKSVKDRSYIILKHPPSHFNEDFRQYAVVIQELDLETSTLNTIFTLTIEEMTQIQNEHGITNYDPEYFDMINCNVFGEGILLLSHTRSFCGWLIDSSNNSVHRIDFLDPVSSVLEIENSEDITKIIQMLSNYEIRRLKNNHFKMSGLLSINIGYGRGILIAYFLELDSKFNIISNKAYDISETDRNLFSLQDGKVQKIMDNKLVDLISGEIKHFDTKSYLDSLFSLTEGLDIENLTESKALEVVDKLIHIANNLGPEYHEYLNGVLELDKLVQLEPFNQFAWKYLLST